MTARPKTRWCCAAAVLAVMFFGGGCAGFRDYMKKRGNDLADCFTVRGGWGYGLGVRAQVTNYCGASLGASFAEEKHGYFGRTSVYAEGGWVGMPVNQLAPFLAFALGASGDGSPSLFFIMLLSPDWRIYDNAGLPSSFKLFGFDVGGMGYRSRMEPETPLIREKFFIEVGATLIAGSFDIGFNPLEFIDFLLGWATVDMTGDDVKVEKKTPDLPPPVQGFPESKEEP